MTARRYLAVLCTLVLGISLGVPARAADTPSKRVLNVQTLYSYLVAPTTQVFPASGVSPVDALFATPAKGRIAPLGENHDLMTVKKYFFGLFPVVSLGSFSQLYTPTAVTFQSITDQPPSVFVEVDVTFKVTALGTFLGLPPNYMLRETGRFTFNKQFQIVSFDLSIPYIDASMLERGEDEPGADPNFLASLIEGICTNTAAQCAPSLTGYASASDCVAALSTLPPGIWNQENTNTITCRAFHSNLLAIDPTNECPIMGVTGGTQCLDSNTYSKYFTETF